MLTLPTLTAIGSILEFTRVNDVYLLLSVTVTSSGGLDDDYAARIKSLLMEEILSAGTTIRLQTFIRPSWKACPALIMSKSEAY